MGERTSQGAKAFYSALHDPQGAFFALFEGEVDD